MEVVGPWASGVVTKERGFCSMHCFWNWVNRMLEERAEGHGIDGQGRTVK
jgi:hypothetical protein